MRIAALIQNDVIVNVIVLGDDDALENLPAMFGVDDAIDISALDPQPGIGWTRENGAWVAPPPPPPPPPTSEQSEEQADTTAADDESAPIESAPEDAAP